MGFWDVAGAVLDPAGIVTGQSALDVAANEFGVGGTNAVGDGMASAANSSLAAAAAAEKAAADRERSMVLMSDNNKTVALNQIAAQSFAVQQASIDRQMQTSANLELGLERLDTNLQTSKLQYIEQMTMEENRHQEKVAKFQGMNAGHVSRKQISGDDIPMPDFES